MITDERLKQIDERAEAADRESGLPDNLGNDAMDLVLEVRRLRVVLAAIGALDPEGVLGETARRAIGAETNPGRPTH